MAYVETAQYTRATHNTFEALFIDNGPDFEEDVFGVRMHTAEDVLESLENIVETVRPPSQCLHYDDTLSLIMLM